MQEALNRRAARSEREGEGGVGNERVGGRGRVSECVAQLVVACEGAAQCLWKRRDGGRFARQQVLEESCRPPHRLAGVVQDVVESRQALGEESREQLDARRVSQIQAVNLQALAERGV